MTTAWRNRIVGTSLEPPDQLVANPRNWRTHPGPQRDALRGSLTEVGWVQQVMVNDRTGFVVDGHARVEEALSKGEPTVPVLHVDLSPEEEALVLATLDPLSAMAIPDDAKLAELLAEITVSDEGLAALLDSMKPQAPTVGLTDPDDVPPLGDESGIKLGDLFALGDHRLMCGDSTNGEDVARLMGGQKVPLVFTSPPYGVGIDYGVFDDTLVNVRKTIAALATVLADVTADGGYAVVNFGDIISAREALGTEEVCEYPMAVEYWGPFRDAGWLLHTRRVWAKPHARVAAPWCASSNRAASDWEHVWTWKRPGRGLNERREPSYLGVWDTSHGEGVTIGKDRFGAGMPVVLAHWALEVYSNAADAVFEPFDGTGTTIIAAEQLGRRCYAMEIDPRYVAVAIKRWSDFTGREAVKL